MDCKTFHKGKYYVTFKRGFEDCKKDLTVTVDKVFESDSLKMSLSDDDDPTFLCVLTITRFDYDELKKQQGLLIDFDNFPSQLVKLLQQCAANNMFLIMQQTNPVLYYLEFVEHNEFKRLVHLSLKTAPATDADIKQHMTKTICLLKKSLSSLKSSSSSTEAILNDKCMNMERKIHDLSHALTRMEEDKLRRELEQREAIKQEQNKLAQDKLQWQRNMESNVKAQLAASQENLNSKDKQIDEMHILCKQLRDNMMQLEKQMNDKSHRLNVLETEVQKSHIEVATLKAKNASLDKEMIEKEKHFNQLNGRCVQLEKTIRENSETIKELTNSLHTAKKEKTSLEERLASSESLALKSKESAQSTSEQLLKANQIISKQNNDIMEMKEKLICRTAIALEQEKVIERNSKEIEDLKSEVSVSKENMERLKTELTNLREKFDTNEKSLKDRDETIKNNNMVIQWLHKKIENCANTDFSERKNNPATSSTPYLLPRSNHTNSTEGLTEESIDFYATSKVSNIDDSPQPTVEKSNRFGLDPKYLKPATDDHQNKPKTGPTKTNLAEPHNSKGKENKNADLPRVDYREKKNSARPTTYRTTPVSAYFP